MSLEDDTVDLHAEDVSDIAPTTWIALASGSSSSTPVVATTSVGEATDIFTCPTMAGTDSHAIAMNGSSSDTIGVVIQ